MHVLFCTFVQGREGAEKERVGRDCTFTPRTIVVPSMKQQLCSNGLGGGGLCFIVAKIKIEYNLHQGDKLSRAYLLPLALVPPLVYSSDRVTSNVLATPGTFSIELVPTKH